MSKKDDATRPRFPGAFICAPQRARANTKGSENFGETQTGPVSEHHDGTVRTKRRWAPGFTLLLAVGVSAVSWAVLAWFIIANR